MIFSELYGAYYNAVADILRAAADHPVESGEMRAIIERKAFGESVLTIEPALRSGRWPLLRPDGTSVLHHAPTMPLTLTEKRWLKAIYSDPRIRLFTDEPPELADIEPLFRPEDVLVFDRYADGDPFEDEKYIRVFRTISDALRTDTPLAVTAQDRRGAKHRSIVRPRYLEYSEKDDKFRLIAAGERSTVIFNLARITDVRPCEHPERVPKRRSRRRKSETVEFELWDQRNALERVLLHFAHFEKRAEKLGERHYKITVTYDRDDETELVIRILSFGAMVRVTAPDSFVNLIKERLKKQKECELS